MKEWTIGAAEHAAHADRMGMSMLALAKADGVGAAAAEYLVEAVKKVGFSTEDAIHAVNRLVIADTSLSKATGLARIAQDAAAIENITAGEALEKLLMAIESGQSRGLDDGHLPASFLSCKFIEKVTDRSLTLAALKQPR